ncbi:MAG: phosphotransferase family protein [Dehalococcoidia bacterium]
MDSEANFGFDPALIDFGVLGAWMDEQALGGGPFEGVSPVLGGSQNILVRFRRGEREYVLRRGPAHLRPASNNVIRREMRLLAALSGTGVRHPGFIRGCADETVMGGAAFYLMEPVDGFGTGPGLPPVQAADASLRREMGLDAAGAIATLGMVDYLAAGLGDYGKPDGFLERQVPRWLAELKTYDALDGYPGPDIPGLEEVARWLDAHRPGNWEPGIMHGDYHFGNIMFAHDSGKVAAIVDWEMSTIGDPLLDLGWILAMWPGTLDVPQVEPPGGPSLVKAGGLPERNAVIARYAEGSSRDLSNVTWYEVLACFKQGIVLEGSHARASAGLAPKEIGDRLHATTMALFKKANTLIGNG